VEEKNPLLESEDYFAPYKKSIEEMRNHPDLIEFDRLCFELFEANTQGKKFIEIMKERYLFPALARVGTPTYQLDVLWGEGMKDFIRMLIAAIRSYQQKIKAGKN
jgi:hypothetical protein